MPQALLGWELGGGLGHLARLRPVAARLLAAGWRVHLASARRSCTAAQFRNLADQWPAELTLGPAPRVSAATRPIATDTLADVLALHGYAEAGTLLPIAAGWRRLLDRLTPELVVADYAPALCLVARGQARLVVVGSGFTVPPPVDPLPPIRPWDATAPEASIGQERRVLAACEAIARANSLPSPSCVAELLQGDATFACCLPLLDPYARHRRRAPWAPYTEGAAPSPTPWPSRPLHSAFVYLPARHPLAEPVERCLAGWSITTGSCQADMANLLGQARLVVHHGGLGTAQAALRAGTPQLLLPRHLEDHITARTLVRLGVASALSAAKAVDDGEITTAIRRATSDHVVAIAQRAAAAVGSLTAGDRTLDVVVETCLGRR